MAKKSNEKHNRLIGVHMPQSFYNFLNLVSEAYEITKTEELRKLLWDWYNARVSIRERYITILANRIQAEWDRKKMKERIFENSRAIKGDQKKASIFLEGVQNRLYTKHISVEDVEQVISKLRL